MAPSALRLFAQHRIITRDGVVTLRGPVETAEEKARIGSLASAPNGVRKVDNQIEVSRKN